MGTCYCVLWWCVLPHHTDLLCLSRARGILPWAAPALFRSGLACGRTKTQEVTGKRLELVCTLVWALSEHWGNWPGVLGTLGWSHVFRANRHFLCVTFNLTTQRISSRLLRNKHICAKLRSLILYIYTCICITLYSTYFIHYWIICSFYGINNWKITLFLNYKATPIAFIHSGSYNKIL